MVQALIRYCKDGGWSSACQPVIFGLLQGRVVDGIRSCVFSRPSFSNYLRSLIGSFAGLNGRKDRRHEHKTKHRQENSGFVRISSHPSRGAAGY